MIPLQAKNAEERERLAAVVARLGDADLERPLSHGWTVRDALVHLAFWDLRAVTLIERYEAHGVSPSPADIEVINDAVLALGRSIPPRAAARLAVEAAAAVDRKLETLPDHVIEALPAAGNPFDLARHAHREEHLDEIERALR